MPIGSVVSSDMNNIQPTGMIFPVNVKGIASSLWNQIPSLGHLITGKTSEDSQAVAQSSLRQASIRAITAGTVGFAFGGPMGLAAGVGGSLIGSLLLSQSNSTIKNAAFMVSLGATLTATIQRDREALMEKYEAGDYQGCVVDILANVAINGVLGGAASTFLLPIIHKIFGEHQDVEAVVKGSLDAAIPLLVAGTKDVIESKACISCAAGQEGPTLPTGLNGSYEFQLEHSVALTDQLTVNEGAVGHIGTSFNRFFSNPIGTPFWVYQEAFESNDYLMPLNYLHYLAYGTLSEIQFNTAVNYLQFNIGFRSMNSNNCVLDQTAIKYTYAENKTLIVPVSYSGSFSSGARNIYAYISFSEAVDRVRLEYLNQGSPSCEFKLPGNPDINGIVVNFVKALKPNYVTDLDNKTLNYYSIHEILPSTTEQLSSTLFLSSSNEISSVVSSEILSTAASSLGLSISDLEMISSSDLFELLSTDSLSPSSVTTIATPNNTVRYVVAGTFGGFGVIIFMTVFGFVIYCVKRDRAKVLEIEKQTKAIQAARNPDIVLASMTVKEESEVLY